MALALFCKVASVAAQDYPSDADIERQRSNLPSVVREHRVQLAQPSTGAKRIAPAPIMPSLPAAQTLGPIKIVGMSVAPGQKQRLSWKPAASVGETDAVPFTVVNGKESGPVLCLVAGIHGDELNGVEVVNRIVSKLTPSRLSGAVIGVPVVNISGFQRNSRYLPDRRDLNRFFPGTAGGSSASRLAHGFFNSVVLACDFVVDFHTGSFERANLPQVRGNLRIREVLEFTRNFGGTTVLHSFGSRGMLRTAATEIGIPAVTFEIGGPIRLEEEEIEYGVLAIETLMNRLEMTARMRVWTQPQPVLYRSEWMRTDIGGLLISSVKLGDKITAGQTLGRVVDPLSGNEQTLRSQLSGKLIGLALNQQVMPGYAVYHIGVESKESDVVLSALKPRLFDRREEELEEEGDEQSERE